MAMANFAHVWFRPFGDELSRTRNDDAAPSIGKGEFRPNIGETDPHLNPSLGRLYSGCSGRLGRRGRLSQIPHDWIMIKAEERTAYGWVRLSGCRTLARAGLDDAV